MKFLVSRTSKYFSKIKPCDEAIKEIVMRECSNGRLRAVEEWLIEINSLEDLIRFVNTYNDIIIQPSIFNDICGVERIEYEIEIYDDYRE